jgi:hypothetical protein
MAQSKAGDWPPGVGPAPPIPARRYHDAGLPVFASSHHAVPRAASLALAAHADISPLLAMPASELRAPGGTTVVIEAHGSRAFYCSVARRP